jgi:hypothetical protein
MTLAPTMDLDMRMVSSTPRTVQDTNGAMRSGGT